MMKIILFIIMMHVFIFDLKKYKFFLSNYCFLLSLFMMMNYKSDMNLFMMYELFGLDKYSYFLIIFTFWLFGLVFLGMKNKEVTNFFLVILMLSLMFFLFMFFSSMNFVLFYVFFEASLIPMFFMILGWGTSSTRFNSSMYMLIYTIAGSLPLLIVIILIGINTDTSMLSLYKFMHLNLGFLYYFMMVVGFLVKLPMYMLHIWLPKAHVDAPCFGSMILAGILLKMGGFGLLRVLLIMPEDSVKFNIYLICFNMVGALVTSIICLRQTDLKMLVAYSSVVHMGMMVSGLMTLSFSGFVGSFYMMIAHGLCSSGLFYLVNVCYERVGSRMIYMNKGMMGVMPSMSMWWFFLSISNMAAPISLNLLSEILLITSLISYSHYMMLYIFIICFLSSAYSIYLFSYVQQGEMNFKVVGMFNSGMMVEFLVVFFHWLPLNLLIFFLEML